MDVRIGAVAATSALQLTPHDAQEWSWRVNYIGTFISVAPDCPADVAAAPTARGGRKSVAVIQHELLTTRPGEHTQEDILWLTHVAHKQLSDADATLQHREQFFAKGQPCLRSSALAKRYGWGFHFDEAGRVKLVPAGSPEYARLQTDPTLDQLTAMRNKRAK